VTPSGSIDGPNIPRTSRVPAIFQNAEGLAAAVNQDGTINSFANPAKPGSIVSIFVNGAGLNRFYPDGALIPPGVSNATRQRLGRHRPIHGGRFRRRRTGSGLRRDADQFPRPGLAAGPQNSLSFNVIVGGIWSNLSLIAVAP
jgi:peptidoglycan hydrolase-like protein with peptidoglycan-binding domain